MTIVAVWGIETGRQQNQIAPEQKTPFLQALGQVWAEPMARRFAIFVFVSMLAYSAQDLVLEPFAGAVSASHRVSRQSFPALITAVSSLG